MDAFNAFLQGDLAYEIYMELPQGFAIQGKKACRLAQSLYGLKQAPRQWNQKLTEALTNLKFEQSQNDHSIFVNNSEIGIIVLLVSVDDMLIIGSSLELIEKINHEVQ